jgi:hypothetical protein
MDVILEFSQGGCGEEGIVGKYWLVLCLMDLVICGRMLMVLSEGGEMLVAVAFFQSRLKGEIATIAFRLVP